MSTQSELAPKCPHCGGPALESFARDHGFPPGTLLCFQCSQTSIGTPAQIAQSKAADAAWEAEQAAERQREIDAKDREQARALFVAAGKPIPEWLR